MSIVSDTLLQLVPSNSRMTPSGWISFDAPCCHHNGHSADTRQRGGIKETGETISYHCFNCGFKASWQPGWLMSYNLRELMSWLGLPDSDISKLALAVLRFRDQEEHEDYFVAIPTFETRTLPEESRLITDDSCDESTQLTKVKEYMLDRKLYRDQGYNYFWSSKIGFRDRLIIPFYYQSRLVGWTSRTIKPNGKPKYLMEKQAGYLFNLDLQTSDKAFCILCEGVLDAIQIDGVATLTNEISDQQAMLLRRLRKPIIVVPDRDQAGRNLIERSIELGYSVSMPDWKENIKDISDAVLEYGQLYTLYSIVNAAESSPLKIRLKEKRWFAKS